MTIKSENDRQFRVLDQMLSMHSDLRDRLKKRALYLNLLLLIVSVFLCALVFADNTIFLPVGLKPKVAETFIRIASVICFTVSIIEYRVDWRGNAAVHADAVRKLAALKSDYCECYSMCGGEDIDKNGVLSKKYSNVMANIVEIPENQFVKLKARHLRKLILSKRISEHPSVPVIILKSQLILEDSIASFKSKHENDKV